MVAPTRGDIWWVDPDPTIGREQSGRRPALIVSTDTLNHGPRNLIMVLLITRANRGYSFHIRLEPSQSGLSAISYVMCEQFRSISKRRLLGTNPVGRVTGSVFEDIEESLRTLLEL